MAKSKLIIIDTEIISENNLAGIENLSSTDTIQLYNDYKSSIVKTVENKKTYTSAFIRIVHTEFGKKYPISSYITDTLDNLNMFKHIYDIYILSDAVHKKPYIDTYNNKGYNIKTISSFNDIDRCRNIKNDIISEEQLSIQRKMVHISLNMNQLKEFENDVFSEKCNLNIYKITDDDMTKKYIPINKNKYIFIDTENVGEAGLEKWQNLDESDMIRLYRSEATKNTVNKILSRKNQTPASIITVDVKFQMKNAMDCMIVNDVHQMTAYRNIYDFIIISHDHDFDAPINQLKSKGFNIARVESIDEICTSTKKTEESNIKNTDPTNNKPIQQQLIENVCNEFLDSTKFSNKFKKILIACITSMSLPQTKFEISSLIPEKDCQIVYQIIEKILAELKIYRIFPPDEIEMPGLESIRNHLKYICVDNCHLDNKQINNLAQKLLKVKNVQQISTAIYSSDIAAKKKKRLEKLLHNFIELVDQIDKQNIKKQKKTIDEDLTKISKELKWLNKQTAYDLYIKLTDVKDIKDLKQILSETTDSKANQIQLLNYIKNNPSSFPNIPPVSILTIIDNIKLLSKQITNEDRSKDKITKLQEELSSNIASDIQEIYKNEHPKQKNHQTKTIKDYCDQNFDRMTSRRLIPIVTNMPTKSMIKRTLFYMFNQDHEKIYQKLEPIITDKPN